MSERTLEAWRHERHGPSCIEVSGGRRAGLFRYRRAALEDWLGAHTFQTRDNRRELAR